jgi:hypothetical protein
MTNSVQATAGKNNSRGWWKIRYRPIEQGIGDWSERLITRAAIKASEHKSSINHVAGNEQTTTESCLPGPN